MVILLTPWAWGNRVEVEYGNCWNSPLWVFGLYAGLYFGLYFIRQMNTTLLDFGRYAESNRLWRCIGIACYYMREKAYLNRSNPYGFWKAVWKAAVDIQLALLDLLKYDRVRNRRLGWFYWPVSEFLTMPSATSLLRDEWSLKISILPYSEREEPLRIISIQTKFGKRGRSKVALPPYPWV